MLFRSIYRMRLKACVKLRSTWSFSWILEAHAASKGFPLAMSITCDFSFRRLCWDQFFFESKKEITLNYTKNYKNEVLWKYDFKNYFYYILRWDSVKNINLKSFRAEQFCLGKFFSIFYSNPTAFRQVPQ